MKKGIFQDASGPAPPYNTPFLHGYIFTVHT